MDFFRSPSSFRNGGNTDIKMLQKKKKEKRMKPAKVSRGK